MIDADVVVIGAGPHGLAATLHLLEARQDLRGRITVLDPSGRWLSAWHDRFARLGIDRLRSPVVHHPSPDPFALRSFLHRAERFGRYELPSTDGFARGCRQMIERADLHDAVTPERALAVVPDDGGLRVVTDAGSLLAEHVVLASGGGVPVVPPWADGAVHAEHLDVRTAAVDGADVVIVGGGLTAAHLALGAVARGADRVTITCRRPLRLAMFDVDPSWLGPKALRGFHAEPDPAVRLATVRAVRDGGSVPAWIGDLIDAEPRIRVCVLPDDADFAAALGAADVGWLATGTRYDACADPVLGPLLDRTGTPSVDGVPVLGPGCRLRGAPVHVLGRGAWLCLGPAAGNLWGARVGAIEVVRSLVGVRAAWELETRG
jgi:cation diffusion facilitator CzcD-associated flavoprotein CzcO